MPLSVVDICNTALSEHLGAAQITDLDQDTVEAAACRQSFDRVRRAALEGPDGYWWNWARSRVVLQELVNDRPEEWAVLYALPMPFLAIRWVNDPEMARIKMAQKESPDIERETGAGGIYCNVFGAVAEITLDIEDTTLWPQVFADFVAARLAAAIAMPVTRSVDLRQTAQQEAIYRAEQAAVWDARNAPVLETPLPSFITARGA